MTATDAPVIDLREHDPVHVHPEPLEPAGEPSWLASNFIFGPTHLPVRF